MIKGALEVPIAERLEVPWSFRAACYLKNPTAEHGVLCFEVICDLGFDTYKQIKCVLDGVLISQPELAVSFASNWAENGAPNDLDVWPLHKNGELWSVVLKRAELDGETLKVVSFGSLAEALVDQGLMVPVKDVEPDA